MWMWCPACERCCKGGEGRTVGSIVLGKGQQQERCPYADCAEPTLLCSWLMVRHVRPDYPQVPERDIRYPVSLAERNLYVI